MDPKMNGGAAPLVGGKCNMCKQPYAPGGPHLALQHCVSSLRERVETLAKILQKRDAMIANYDVMSKLVWALANKTEGNNLAVTFEELKAVSKDACMVVQRDDKAKQFLMIAATREVKS